MKYVIKYEGKKTKDYGWLDEETIRDMLRGYKETKKGMYERKGSKSWYSVENNKY